MRASDSASLLSVIDASVSSAWILDDESDPFADEVYASLQASAGVVPQHWHFEIRNALLIAERRGRVSSDSISGHLLTLSELGLQTDIIPDLDAAFNLAQKHRLTFYDALYLELARRRSLPLATLDNALERAADAEGLPALALI